MNAIRDELVSVIVPVYNGVRTVARAIDSALAQTGVALEVVVVDDASTDDTLAFLRRRYAEDPRVRIFSCARNGGPSVARNRAIDEARGDWLAVLDADDRYRPGRLARLLAGAQQQQADVIADAYSMCDPATLQPYALRGAGIARGQLPPAELVRRNIGSCKPLFRAGVLRETGIRYAPAVRQAEDLLLLVELALAGARLCFEPAVGYDKIIEPTSITAHRESLLPGVIATYRGLLARDDVRADTGLHRALATHLPHILDAGAANRLRGAWRRNGLRYAATLLLREPALLPATLRHLLLRKKRFAESKPA